MVKMKGKTVFQSQEAFQRMNFLYQGCETMMKQCPPKPDIAAFYANLMANISKKAVLRMEPKIKRTLCKGCFSLMIPGVNARVRLRKKSSQRLVWTCLRCNTVKRYNTMEDHQLWCENPQSVGEVMTLDSPSDEVVAVGKIQDKTEESKEQVS